MGHRPTDRSGQPMTNRLLMRFWRYLEEALSAASMWCYRRYERRYVAYAQRPASTDRPTEGNQP